MQKLAKFYPAALVTALLLWRYGNDSVNAVWMSRYCVLLVVIGVLPVEKLGKYLAPVLGLATASSIIGAMWFRRYSSEPFEVQAVLRQASSEAGLTLLIFWLFFGTVKQATARAFEGSLGVAGFLTALFILLSKLFGLDVTRQIPFFDNPSMGACFIVLTFPLFTVALMRSWLVPFPAMCSIWAVCLTAVYCTHTTAPVVALAGFLVAWLYLTKWWGTLIGLAVTGLLLLPLVNPSDNGRFHLWGLAFDWWRSQGWGSMLFGVGLGTTRVWLPIIQVGAGADVNVGPWYFFMHNDWLQIGFELGVVGLLASLWAFYGLLRYARSAPYLAASIVAYGCVMLVNFPMHWPLHSFLGCLLVRLAFAENLSYQEKTWEK